MNWPWVSRKRLEDAERRFTECDTERRDLLDRLLERQEKPAVKPNVSVEEDSTFTTPFDRIGARFDKAGPAARHPKFKARMR